MDWLFENLGKFAPVVVFIIYMLSSLKGKGREEEAPADPEASERARKIQEEIRRKILERQGGQKSGDQERGQDPEEEETVVFKPEPIRPIGDPEKSEPTRPLGSPVPVELAREEVGDAIDPYAKRRREIEAKMEEAKRMRSVAKEKAKAIRNTFTTADRGTGGDFKRGLRRGLAGPDSLKTSIVLSDILDKPVSLRG